MKKILIVVLFVFILTGCNNVVSVDFNSNIDTKINVSFTLDEYKQYSGSLSDRENLDEEIDAIISEMRPISDNYDEMFKENSMNRNGYTYTGEFEYTYNYANFRYSELFNRCFDSFVVDEEDNLIHIFLKGDSICAPFTLKVKAVDRMLNNNADSSNKGEYTWEVKKEDNEIKFDISKNPIEPSGLSTKSIIYVIIAIIMGIAAFIFSGKLKK